MKDRIVRFVFFWGAQLEADFPNISTVQWSFSSPYEQQGRLKESISVCRFVGATVRSRNSFWWKTWAKCMASGFEHVRKWRWRVGELKCIQMWSRFESFRRNDSIKDWTCWKLLLSFPLVFNHFISEIMWLVSATIYIFPPFVPPKPPRGWPRKQISHPALSHRPKMPCNIASAGSSWPSFWTYGPTRSFITSRGSPTKISKRRMWSQFWSTIKWLVFMYRWYRRCPMISHSLNFHTLSCPPPLEIRPY